MNESGATGEGIVYVATGDSTYAQMCLASISSLRDWGYRGSVFIVTDRTDIRWPQERTIIYQVADHPQASSSRYWKTQLGRLSPFEKNIFLDCDILAASSLEHIWDEVRAVGVGLALDEYPTLHQALVSEYQYLMSGAKKRTFSPEEQRCTAEIALSDCPYYNSGVIFWRNDAESAKFFSDWHDEWKRFCGRDQFALARALNSSGVTVYCLSSGFNFRTPRIVPLAKVINRNITFVHFSGEHEKRAFGFFSREISAYKALDGLTQKKLEAAVGVRMFRDVDAVRLLPLLFTFSLAESVRVFRFIILTVISILRARRQAKKPGDG